MLPDALLVGWEPGGSKRGPVVKVPERKEKITIRIDSDILGWFRRAVDEAGGGNYQTS
jgi:uncharacterized protein (DUF4415 family)